jgi:hypothetical protein
VPGKHTWRDLAIHLAQTGASWIENAAVAQIEERFFDFVRRPSQGSLRGKNRKTLRSDPLSGQAE